jgi:catechol 2,3-dioxygenase-like lactoylglutathione lyase family enzyme
MLDKLEALVTAFETGALGRREFLQALLVTAVAPGAAAGVTAGAPPQAAKPATAVSLNHVTLAVRDVDASQAFYERVLGISEVSRQFNGVNLGLGDSFLGLYDVEPRGQIHHFCVGVEGFDLEAHAEGLSEQGVEPLIREDRPELYFMDPDGIRVQLSAAEYRG